MGIMCHILSISSNQAMNYLLKTVLEKKAEVTAASDVFEGLLALKKNPKIDVVIIDIDNQLKEGMDFIFHLKSSWLFYRPVIVLTSHREPEVTERLIEANVYEYFTKPFSPLELIQSIEELISSNAILQQ